MTAALNFDRKYTDEEAGAVREGIAERRAGFRLE